MQAFLRLEELFGHPLASHEGEASAETPFSEVIHFSLFAKEVQS
jgi:hypothetical protein